jgi:hypothetical protein
MCQAGKEVLMFIVDRKFLYGLLDYRITNLSGKMFLDGFRGRAKTINLDQKDLR